MYLEQEMRVKGKILIVGNEILWFEEGYLVVREMIRKFLGKSQV